MVAMILDKVTENYVNHHKKKKKKKMIKKRKKPLQKVKIQLDIHVCSELFAEN